MKSKKFVSMFLALIMLGCCFGMIPANAAASSSVSRGLSKLDLESVYAADRAIIMDASTYAYMSLENASDSVATKILKARSDIIFHQSWSLDGQAKIVHRDGTYEVLPEFYDLFPETWDIPCENTNAFKTQLNNLPGLVYSGTVDVPQRTNTNSFCFTWYKATHVMSAIQPTVLNGISTINVGFTNGSTGQSIAYALNLSAYDDLTANTTPGTMYGARVSTNENTSSGTAFVTVYNANDILLPIGY